MYGIFTYIWLMFFGKYTSPIDPMGKETRVMAEALCLWRQCLVVKNPGLAVIPTREPVLFGNSEKQKTHIYPIQQKKQNKSFIFTYINNINTINNINIFKKTH